MARISGNDKLFRLDLADGKKTQLTFGTHDDAAAQFLDADTLVFTSTAIDPARPITPEDARNGNIYNLWTLNLKTGELRQFTDTLTATSRRSRSSEGNIDEGGVRHLLQGRVRHPLAGAEGAHGHRRHRATSASRARSSTSRRRSRTRWCRRTSSGKGRSRSCSSTAGRRWTSA